MRQAFLKVTVVKDAKSAVFLKNKSLSQSHNMCCAFKEEEDKGTVKILLSSLEGKSRSGDFHPSFTFALKGLILFEI